MKEKSLKISNIYHKFTLNLIMCLRLADKNSAGQVHFVNQVLKLLGFSWDFLRSIQFVFVLTKHQSKQIF